MKPKPASGGKNKPTVHKDQPAPKPVVNQLYGRYFQKSKSFIYPQLGISKFVAFPPAQSYLAWPDKNITAEHNKLILLYKYQEREPGWLDFVNNKLIKHPMFESVYYLPENERAFVFNMDSIASDMSLLRNGKYSWVSASARAAIRTFFGLGSHEWAYMETFLQPKDHFALYAELLDAPVDDLIKTGELCDPPNMEKETLLLVSDYIDPMLKRAVETV